LPLKSSLLKRAGYHGDGGIGGSDRLLCFVQLTRPLSGGWSRNDETVLILEVLKWNYSPACCRDEGHAGPGCRVK
jgi:hypothetical protein